MIIDLLNYSGIVTKTKAMEARLISKKDFEDLSSLTSVTEFINFLKTKPAYQSLFSNCDERLLHRNEIEHMLTYSLYLEYAKLFRFASIKQRKTFHYIFFRYEVNILKACLRNVFTDEDSYDLSVFEPFFAKHSKLNIRSLASSSTMDEFISHLKGTQYYDFFHKIQQTSNPTLYDYEVQLDICYFMSIWKNKKKFFKARELNILTDIIGKKIDFLNLMWIYRSKKFYDVDTAHIYSYIIPVHYKLSSDQLMKLIETGSLDEFNTLLQSTFYHESDENIKNSHFSVENLYQEHLFNLYHTNRQKYPISMCTIFYFLYMKELEIDRLTTALECIRYGLDSSHALNYIF